MKEYQLFTQPHDELLRTATNLGIVGASALTMAQLVRAITEAQAAQVRGTPWAQTPRVIFRPTEQVQTALIHNPTTRPVRLSLEVVGSNRTFTIPAELKDVVLQGNDTLSVPVRFSPPTKGVLMTSSAHYAACISVRDHEAGSIVTTVYLSGTGRGYQAASCIVSPQPEVLQGSIETTTNRRSSRFGLQNRTNPELEGYDDWYGQVKIDLWASSELVSEGDLVSVGWQVTGATAIGPGSVYYNVWYCAPDITDIPISPGGRNEWGMETQPGGSGGNVWYPATYGSTQPSFTWELRLYYTLCVELFVGYASGNPGFIADRWIFIHRKIPIGYGNATTAGPIWVGELNTLRGFLSDIEGKLKGPDPVHHPEWGGICTNTALDRFNDPYLRDPGGVTKDILNAMQSVHIYLTTQDLPLDDRNRLVHPYGLCARHLSYDANGNLQEDYSIIGSTPYEWQGDVLHRKWVGICRGFLDGDGSGNADALTLLHELYHYSVAQNHINRNPNAVDSVTNLHPEEAKANIVATGCFH